MLIEILNEKFHGEIPSIINNYLSLYDILDVNQSQLLKKILNKIDTYKVESINVIVQGLIVDGLMINPMKKKNRNIINDNEISNLIKIIFNTNYEGINDIEKVYYLKTLITLIQKINYIDEEEQFIFNCLFEEFKWQNKKIEQFDNEERRFIIK